MSKRGDQPSCGVQIHQCHPLDLGRLQRPGRQVVLTDPTAIEDHLDGVVPTEIGRHPVHDEQSADGKLDAEFLSDFANRALSRRLVRLDDAARQFPIGLELGLAEQHPTDLIPKQTCAIRRFFGSAEFITPEKPCGPYVWSEASRANRQTSPYKPSGRSIAWRRIPSIRKPARSTPRRAPTSSAGTDTSRRRKPRFCRASSAAVLRARISESGLTAPCHVKVAMPLSTTLTEISTSLTLEVSQPLVVRPVPDWWAMRGSPGCSVTRGSLGCSVTRGSLGRLTKTRPPAWIAGDLALLSMPRPLTLCAVMPPWRLRGRRVSPSPVRGPAPHRVRAQASATPHQAGGS